METRVQSYWSAAYLRNHVDPKCKQLYNADDKVPEQFNTMACEQTFVWANLCVGQPFQKDYLCNASHTSVFLSSSLGEVSEPLHWKMPQEFKNSCTAETGKKCSAVVHWNATLKGWLENYHTILAYPCIKSIEIIHIECVLHHELCLRSLKKLIVFIPRTKVLPNCLLYNLYRNMTKQESKNALSRLKGGFPARCECLHLIKMNCLALWLDESAHASLAARSFVRGLEIRL
jgi:hypothetical protein